MTADLPGITMSLYIGIYSCSSISGIKTSCKNQQSTFFCSNLYLNLFLQPWDSTELWLGDLSDDGHSLKHGTKRKVKKSKIM